MSLGYCGRIELFAEGESTVIYRYGGENWNTTGRTRGDILVRKRCLLEPEIHFKLKRTASHKRIETKKHIIQRVDFPESIKSGDIKIIKPCSSEQSMSIKSHGVENFFASRLLDKVFIDYQKTGTHPKSCSFMM